MEKSINLSCSAENGDLIFVWTLKILPHKHMMTGHNQ